MGSNCGQLNSQKMCCTTHVCMWRILLCTGSANVHSVCDTFDFVFLVSTKELTIRTTANGEQVNGFLSLSGVAVVKMVSVQLRSHILTGAVGQQVP